MIWLITANDELPNWRTTTQLKVKKIAAIQLNRYQKPNQPYDWLFKPNKPKLSVSQLK